MWTNNTKNGTPHLIDTNTKQLYYTAPFEAQLQPLDPSTLKYSMPGIVESKLEKILQEPSEMEYAQEFQAKILQVPGARLLPALGYKEWDGHIFVCGSTMSGKSWAIKDMLLNDKKKRKIFLITDLQEKDPSFKELYATGRLKRVREHPGDHRVDISIRKFNDQIDGSFVVFDDVSPANKKINGFRDRLLEKGRHRKITVIVVSHAMRDYHKTKAPLTDSEFIVCFPNANHSAISGFLADKLRMKAREVRMYMHEASKDGRHMCVHLWNPNFLSTEQKAFVL